MEVKLNKMAIPVRNGIQKELDIRLKTSHVYEIVAAGYGFHSYNNMRKIIIDGLEMRPPTFSPGQMLGSIIKLCNMDRVQAKSVQKSLMDNLARIDFNFDRWVNEIKEEAESKKCP